MFIASVSSEPIDRRPPRAAGELGGRRFALLLVGAILLVLVCVLLLFRWGRGHAGEVLELAAIDDERVVTLREGLRPGFVRLSVEDREGHERWSELLFGVEPAIPPLVRGGRVFVRALEARGRRQTHAFDLESGELIWRGPALPIPGADPPRRARIALPGALVEIHGSGPVHLLGLSWEEGEALLEHTLADPEASLFALDALLLSLEEGRLRPLFPIAGPGWPAAAACVLEREALLLSAEGALSRLEPGAGAPEPLAQGLAVSPLVACGRRGARRLLLFGDPARGSVDRVLALEPDGEPAFELRLEPSAASSTASSTGPRRVSYAPRLPGRLPVFGPGGAVHLLDLDAGSAAICEASCGPLDGLLTVAELSFLSGPSGLHWISAPGAMSASGSLPFEGIVPLGRGADGPGRLWIAAGGRVHALRYERPSEDAPPQGASSGTESACLLSCL
ncbi:MAG: PQQ-like beta-propeller repeat protein [Myxococcales bacterium]|nr:PQQ-like beta-propeller repeat protein [Myxococcales bacterium]